MLEALARQHRIERFSLSRALPTRSLQPQWLSAGAVRLGSLIQALDTSKTMAEAQDGKQAESGTRQETAQRQKSERADENTTQAPNRTEAVFNSDG